MIIQTKGKPDFIHPGHGKFFESDVVGSLKPEHAAAYIPESDKPYQISYFRKLDGSSITSFIHPNSGIFMLRSPRSLSNDVLDGAKLLITPELAEFGNHLNDLPEPAFACFEYVSPSNTVVEFYKKPRLILTAIRRYNGEYYSSTDFAELRDQFDQLDWNEPPTFVPDMSIRGEGYVGSFTNKYGYTSFTKLKTNWFEQLHGNRLNVLGDISGAWIARSYMNNTMGYLTKYTVELATDDPVWTIKQFESFAPIFSKIESLRKEGVSDTVIYKRMNDNTQSSFSIATITRAWATGHRTKLINNTSGVMRTDVADFFYELDNKFDGLKEEIRVIEADYKRLDRSEFFTKYNKHALFNSIIKQLVIPGKVVTELAIKGAIANKAKGSVAKFMDFMK
jgi:hypothetical protein